MKRKGLVLDFTSFLDVILILLFLVIAGMNRSVLSAEAASEEALLEAENRIQVVSAERDAAAAEAARLLEAERDYGALEEEFSRLQEQYRVAREENERLQAAAGHGGEDILAYEAAMERMTRITLICNTEQKGQEGHPVVQVEIYQGSGRAEEASYAGQIRIVHDFSLTREERARLQGEQAAEMTKTLKAALQGGENRMIWFSIQYAYDDINFSNSDLRILEEAIANLERSLPVSCYVERIKLY